MGLTRIALVLLSCGVAFAGKREKIAPDLKQLPRNQAVDVIVKWRNGMSDRTDRLLKTGGGQKKSDLNLVGSTLYRVTAGQASALDNDPDVESVQPDRPVTATAFSGGPDYGWVAAFNTSRPAGFDGTGIGVAVLDSGIDDREDFKDPKGHVRIVYKQSFVVGDTSTGDGYGHGNHVSGIIAGSGRKSTGGHFDYLIRGIANNTNLISLRVLDKYGASTDSAVIAAIDRAIQLRATYNIRVLNLSLGRLVMSSYLDDPLCQAVQRAWEAGITVVVAAGNNGRDNSFGNDGYGTITSPGNSPYAITVGAMNTRGTPDRADDIVTSYSSKGPTVIDHIVKPDLVAPGNRILSVRDSDSVLDKQFVENRVPVYVYSTDNTTGTPDYFLMSGTSMAAPMVSGAAALLVQKDPTLKPDQIKAILMATASKFPAMSTTSFDAATGYQWTSQYDMFTIGAGYLDISAALANTDQPLGNALSPTAAYDEASQNVFLVTDMGSVWGSQSHWGTQSRWGTSAVWGAQTVWGTASIWGTSAVWGANTTSGFQTIWGVQTRWGTQSIFGTDQTVGALSVMMEGDL